jgi:hypothetical protein
MTGSDVPSLSGLYLKKSQTTFCWDRPSRNRKDVGEAAFLNPEGFLWRVASFLLSGAFGKAAGFFNE